FCGKRQTGENHLHLQRPRPRPQRPLPRLQRRQSGPNSMMATMAVELFEHHINVNVIEPGWIDTPGERHHYDEETMAAEARKLPWGRLGTAEDVGKAALYLSSDDADYVTGTLLPVDGGYRLKHCRDIPEESD